MANTRVNEFDTFQYEQVADYLPGLKQRYAEENQGFEDAEVIAKQNDQQRLANAKLYGRVINEAQSLSKTLANKYKEKAKNDEKIFNNRASMIQMEIGASSIDKANYEAERRKLGEEHSAISYYIWKAEQQGFDSAYIKDLQSMSSLDVVRMDEVLAWNHAANYKDNFFGADGIRARNEDGSAKYSIEVDGEFIEWDDADINQKRQLMREFDEQTGWTPISEFRTEFLEGRSLTTLTASKGKIIAEEEAAAKLKLAEERVDGMSEYIVAAAKNNQLGFALYSLEQEEYTRHADQYGAGGRSNIRNLFKEKVKELVNDGTITLAQADLTGFTFPHKGTGKDETLEVYDEYKNFTNEITNVLVAKNKQVSAQKSAFGTSFVQQALAKSKEANMPIDENLLAQLIPQFKEEYFEMFGEYPTQADIPKDLINLPTVEDRSDEEWVQNLEYLERNNLPIKYADYAHIHDEKLRASWAEKAATSQLDSYSAGQMKINVPQLASELRNEFIGKNDYKSRELTNLQSQLEQKYKEIHASLKPGLEPGQEKALHETVMDRLEAYARKHGWNGELEEVSKKDFGKVWITSIQDGRNHISESVADGNSISDTLGNGVLPGSEHQMKRLEKYAADPINFRIPPYYTRISDGIKNMDAYDVANLQYHAQQRAAGIYEVKDLPMTPQKQYLNSLPPIFRMGVVNKGNPTKVVRYSMYAEKSDFNHEHLYPYENSTILKKNLELINDR